MEKFSHLTQSETFSVHHVEPDEVYPVVLVGFRGGKACAGDKDACAFEQLGIVAVVDVLRMGDDGVGVVFGFL